MRLPSARGPLSAEILATLRRQVPVDPRTTIECAERSLSTGNVLFDEDFQLSLWVLYELHYGGFDEVDPEWEWDPGLLEQRRNLERALEVELRRRTSEHVDAALEAEGDLPTRMFELPETFEGPSVARFVQREATRTQLIELLVHRSIYHLKESDPSSWVIPRITGKPKAALVELLYDEYGGGRPDRLHATMFADGLRGCGLSGEYGTYLEQVPAITLATNNTMSLFGLHRRLRAASMGHMGAFEATSSLPARKLAGGIRRLGLGEQLAGYFDEHVEADAVHEQLALRDICAELVRQDPSLERDVFFGAASCLALDAVSGKLMLDAWRADHSSLREPPGHAEEVA